MTTERDDCGSSVQRPAQQRLAACPQGSIEHHRSGTAFRCCTERLARSACAAALILSGCGPAAPQRTAAPPSPPANVVLDVPETSFDAGYVGIADDVQHEFVVTNRSPTPQTVTVGAPSCGCLEAAFAPATLLEPGQTGRLRLALDLPRRREAGVFGGRVVLGVAGSTESHTLELKARVTGLAFAGSPVLFEFQHRQPPANAEIPLTCYSSQRAVDVQVTQVELERHPRVRRGPPPGGASPDAARPPVDESGFRVALRPDQLALQSGVALRDGTFERGVRIPVDFSGEPAESFEGRFRIHYTLDGEERPPLFAPFLVIAHALPRR